MLSKGQRIPKAFARELFMRGSGVSSPNFLLKIDKATDNTTRFAVSVSKKIAPTAVSRNRIRRRVYSAIRTLLPRVKSGFLAAISVKKTGVKLSGANLAKEIENLLRRAGIISNS